MPLVSAASNRWH